MAQAGSSFGAEPSAPTYGCHVDIADGGQPDGCVLDYGTPHDCVFGVFPSGRVRRSKRTCAYWLRIENVLKPCSDATAI